MKHLFPALFLLAASCAVAPPVAPSAHPAGAYTSGVVDLGIVVRDIEASAAFYHGALGLEEIPGFTGAAKVTGDSGLADYQAVPVRQFVLPGCKDGGTKLKLMQFAARPGKLADQEYLHSTVGLRYVTLFVGDMDATLDRLRSAGIRPLAKGPVPIPGTAVKLAVVKDPDGNFIELVGP